MQCLYPHSCSVLLWKYGMEDLWAITQSDHARPEGISSSYDKLTTVLQKLL
jgi:hypothetical protein